MLVVEDDGAAALAVVVGAGADDDAAGADAVDVVAADAPVDEVLAVPLAEAVEELAPLDSEPPLGGSTDTPPLLLGADAVELLAPLAAPVDA